MTNINKMSFEKDYYESPAFWAEGMVSDQLNLIRIQETINMIPSDVTTLLDVGCGNGVFPNLLSESKNNIKVTATDRSKEALKYVRTEKFESDISALPVEPQSFDCVTCLQVIEHIPDSLYKPSLSELARVARRYLIVSIPFNEDLEKGFTQCPKCRTLFNSDLHFRNYTLDTMKNLFAEYDFSLIASRNVVEGEKYVGVEYYSKLRSLFTQTSSSVFNSPICPVCGYRNESFNSTLSIKDNDLKPKNASMIKKFLRSIWPKTKIPGYWLISLYERN